MRTVKQLATGGVTVCATIHSPTSYCFSLFDRLIMLVQGQGGSDECSSWLSLRVCGHCFRRLEAIGSNASVMVLLL